MYPVIPAPVALEPFLGAASFTGVATSERVSIVTRKRHSLIKQLNVRYYIYESNRYSTTWSR